MFTAEGAWAYTIWDISKRHLEDVVKNAVTAAHPGYVIDDADFIETPDGSYFLGRDGARGKGNLRKGDSGR